MVAAPPRPEALDVVIRTHDPSRLDELERAVFSVLLADFQPVTPLIVCQRFPTAALDAARARFAPLEAIAGRNVRLLNRPEAEPNDARAALLNLGLRAGSSRYLAFLDYDDLIYPEGHRLLIEELRRGPAAIAFGGVLNATVDCDGLLPYITAKRHVFHGEGLRQLLHSNFCPLHSYVLDRARITEDDLVVDEGLAALEDYDFLLRLCSRYPSSFTLKDVMIGEYLLKDDGSNLNPMAHGGPDPAWEAAKAEIWSRKAGHMLTRPVQAQLGIDHPGMTTAAYLARYAAGL